MYQVSCFYHKTHDFFTYPPHYKHYQLLSPANFSCGDFITLPTLTLPAFKVKYTTLKYAQLLKIVILALRQERLILLYHSLNTQRA